MMPDGLNTSVGDRYAYAAGVPMDRRTAAAAERAKAIRFIMGVGMKSDQYTRKTVSEPAGNSGFWALISGFFGWKKI